IRHLRYFCAAASWTNDTSGASSRCAHLSSVASVRMVVAPLSTFKVMICELGRRACGTSSVLRPQDLGIEEARRRAPADSLHGRRLVEEADRADQRAEAGRLRERRRL